MHQLIIDLKKVYDPVRREVLYNILTEFSILIKLVRLIKVCLNETYSRVQVGELLSDMFPSKNSLIQGGAWLPLLFIFASEYAIRRVHVYPDSLKLNGTHQLVIYADGVNILSRSIHTIKKNTEAIVDASKKIQIEVNADKT